MNNLERPTIQLVNKCLTKFEENVRYVKADEAIKNLFRAFPENKKIEDVLLKISVINDLYNTNIFGTYKMAKHIQMLDIDEKLRLGATELVDLIATGHNIKRKQTNAEIRFYSFATKYCSWHNSEAYPIYDQFVEKILMAYKKQDKFDSFKREDLKTFIYFQEIIENFINYYGLMSYSLKEIDQFLWVYGKELFPASYTKVV